MNSTEYLLKNFKKKFHKHLEETLASPNTSMNSKNVSWAVLEESGNKSKKIVRSTPYPKPSKKMKISNSTPKTLSFDDSDDCFDKEGSFTTVTDISKLCKPKNQGTKRKRPQNLTSNWTVTSCNEIKPDKFNNRFNSQKILNLESSSESFEDESVLSMDMNASQHCEKIYVHEKVPHVTFDIDSEEESSDSGTEQIFSLKLPNLNKCEILKPKVVFTYELKENKNFQTSDKSTQSESDEPISNVQTKPETEIIENLKQIKKSINFTRTIKSVVTENSVILFIKHSLKLFVHGKISVKVLHGQVEILGYNVNSSQEKSFEVYSPRGQSFLCLEIVECNNDSKEDLKKKLSNYNIPTKQLKDYVYLLESSGCVLEIKNINNNLTNYLSTHVAQHIFPKPIQCERLFEKKLNCLFDFEESTWRKYIKNEDWNLCIKAAYNDLKQLGFSRTLICGGKSVGKSTLYRFLINSMLNETDKVVCIDLDPGQSEFTVSGCISAILIDKPIFGPNFTHLKTPIKSYFIGDVSIINCVDRYIESIKELLIYCERNIDKKYPWIINYMGFTKSIGTDLITSVIKLLSPSTVVQINSNIKNKNYPANLSAEYVQNYVYSFPIITPETKLTYNLLLLDSNVEENTEEFQFEPKNLRDMSIISYFSEMIDEIGKEITSVAPYSVKMSSIKLHDLEYNKENLPAVLNGNLVALCKTKVETINNTTTFDCLGFGIVRGIDIDSNELYLLTPVPETDLANVNSLVRGKINLPPSLYMVTGRQGLVPYIVLGSQQGTRSVPKRSYISFKSLLKKNSSVI